MGVVHAAQLWRQVRHVWQVGQWGTRENAHSPSCVCAGVVGYQGAHVCGRSILVCVVCLRTVAWAVYRMPAVATGPAQALQAAVSLCVSLWPVPRGHGPHFPTLLGYRLVSPHASLRIVPSMSCIALLNAHPHPPPPLDQYLHLCWHVHPTYSIRCVRFLTTPPPPLPLSLPLPVCGRAPAPCRVWASLWRPLTTTPSCTTS